LKKVGHLTSPETRSGKVFAKAERGLTQVAARLAESPTFLRVSGGLMRRGFTLQIRRTSMMEKTLHSLRVPTSSEVETLRDQLRRMNDQVEALGSQLEHVVELLERQEQHPAQPVADSTPAPRRRRSSRSLP
jgi:TolA-binding protein